MKLPGFQHIKHILIFHPFIFVFCITDSTGFKFPRSLLTLFRGLLRYQIFNIFVMFSNKFKSNVSVYN